MEVEFSSDSLKKELSIEKKLNRKHPRNAKKIKMRLAQLDAFDNLAQLLMDTESKRGRFHQLTADRKGQFAGDLEHPARIIFIPNNDPSPVKPDGSLDLEKITKVMVVEICTDYHKKKRRR